MGTDASGAILDSLFCILKLAAALISQSIQGTITEQAVKVFFINTLMAGEIFTVWIPAEFIVFHGHLSKSFTIHFLYGIISPGGDYHPRSD